MQIRNRATAKKNLERKKEKGVSLSKKEVRKYGKKKMTRKNKLIKNEGKNVKFEAQKSEAPFNTRKNKYLTKLREG